MLITLPGIDTCEKNCLVLNAYSSMATTVFPSIIEGITRDPAKNLLPSAVTPVIVIFVPEVVYVKRGSHFAYKTISFK